MVNDKKKTLIIIGAFLLWLVALFLLFVKLAGSAAYSIGIIMVFTILIFACLIFSFLSEDNEDFEKSYYILLILTVVIPALMFIASVVHKNNLIKF